MHLRWLITYSLKDGKIKDKQTSATKTRPQIHECMYVGVCTSACMCVPTLCACAKVTTTTPTPWDYSPEARQALCTMNAFGQPQVQSQLDGNNGGPTDLGWHQDGSSNHNV